MPLPPPPQSQILRCALGRGQAAIRVGCTKTRSPALQDSLRASYAYVPPCDRIDPYSRTPATMRHAGHSGQGPQAAGRPPDLPSLLLDNRIVFIGMPLVPSVSELVVSELLWLQYASRDKPIHMYFNSIGSQNHNFESIAWESEAYAILDTMNVRACIYFPL